MEVGTETILSEDINLLQVIEENERMATVVEAGNAQVQMGKKKKVDKGKRPVKEAPKSLKKRARPKKPAAKRYSTRSGGESSRQREEEIEYSSESSTDSDDPNFDGIVDSDYDLNSEDDDVDFEENVDGDTRRVDEWDEMGFEGHISDYGGDESDGLKSLNGSSDDEDRDRGRFSCKEFEWFF